MSKVKNAVRGGVVLSLFLIVASCAATYRNHGYAPTEFDLQEITVGADTRETVAELIGQPTSTGVLQDSAWYYVQSRWRYFGARAPKVLERQLVAISFTSSGVVQNIERFGLEDGRVVTLNRRVTETNIANVNFITQILGNFGNFSADQILN